MKVIKVRKGVAHIKYRRCIRCYTCHEMCTSEAIGLKRSMGGRFVSFIFERRNRPRAER
jgi:formate hydrogenlyase subunit 6/NADH:ubiquinone oxidoreductase subunit I